MFQSCGALFTADMFIVLSDNQYNSILHEFTFNINFYESSLKECYTGEPDWWAF